MPIKIFAAVVAVVLMTGFVIPVAFKLKEIPLAVMILIGIAMMLIDLVQSLKAKDD